MRSASKPYNEEERIQALLSYKILDTEPEGCYDDLVTLASLICETPISLVSLVDKDRQWFKAKVGLSACETHRDLAFCAHAILQDDLFIVADTLNDERFADNPLVTGGPQIRFYAGTPLKTTDGFVLGTLCVIDSKPHVITESQRQALAALGRQVVSQLELRLHSFRLQKMNDYKSRFLRMLSHDLRGAFNTVLGFSQMLARRVDSLSPQEIIKYTNQIHLSADSAYRQLNTLLDWSRFELGNFPFNPQKHYANELCEAAVDFVKSTAQGKNITIIQDCQKDLIIEADHCMLMSVLQNLLSNSIKFSSSGSKIELVVHGDIGEIIFKIIDHGVGMSAEKAKALFEKNQIVSMEGTMGEQGTGIGSLLIREFVDKHGGHVEASSTLGQGTTVMVRIPNTVTCAFLGSANGDGLSHHRA